MNGNDGRLDGTSRTTNPDSPDVLVVEDNPGDVRLLRETFARAGRTVAVAGCIEEATNRLAEPAPAVNPESYFWTSISPTGTVSNCSERSTRTTNSRTGP